MVFFINFRPQELEIWNFRVGLQIQIKFSNSRSLNFLDPLILGKFTSPPLGGKNVNPQGEGVPPGEMDCAYYPLKFRGKITP